MFAAQSLLNKLYAHKWLLQACIPALVAADTVHSGYVVAQLAKDRLKVILNI